MPTLFTGALCGVHVENHTPEVVLRLGLRDHANSASKVRPSDQPITRREKAPNTAARYTNSRNSRM